MSGWTMPADVQADLDSRAQKIMLEEYMRPNRVVPRIFEVRSIDGMETHELYDQETVQVAEDEPVERRPGDETKLHTMRDGKVVVYRKRFVEQSFMLPLELAKAYSTPGAGDRAMAGLEAWLRKMMPKFAEGRVRKEERDCADLFNYGGYTAGHNATFNNSVPGAVQDASGDLIYTGKPFFALSGNNHPNLANGSFYNSGGALSLTTTNVDTQLILVESTNAYDEMGKEIDINCDVLLVPKALRLTGEVICESLLKSGTANNDKNIHRRLELVPWAFLSDTNGWFVGQAGKGIVFYQGGAPDIRQSYDDDHRGWKVSIQSEHAVGVKDWRPWAAANISTS